MKKYYSLIDKVYSIKNLKKALEKVEKKSKKVEKTLDLEELGREIKEGGYESTQLKGINLKISGKSREIAILSFKDKVVQLAYREILEPLYEKIFIENSYAFRKGKGIFKALEYLKRKRYRKFVLKADIQDFFHSINHEILLRILRKRITDSSFLNLTEKLLKLEVKFKDGKIKRFQNKGVPLGTFCSQLFANIYLHELDSFIVNELKIREYIRYCDDFLLLLSNKEGQ